ncbi:hypothetical protein ABBQ38_011429 [Trebouxia sp. C0009 RCD-2024]
MLSRTNSHMGHTTLCWRWTSHHGKDAPGMVSAGHQDALQLTKMPSALTCAGFCKCLRWKTLLQGCQKE